MQQPTSNLCRRSSSGSHDRLHVVYLSGLVLLGLIAVALFSDNQGLASSVPGLVSQWSAEGNANDSVGSNNGTLVNGASFAPGVVGQAFSLDGVDDVVRVPNSESLSFGPTSPMSVVVWVYRTGNGGIMHIVSKRSSCSDFNYQMAFDPGGGLGFGAISGVDLPLNQWTHLAGTFDGSVFNLYINGQLRATGSGTLGPVNSDDLQIGGAGACGFTFGGLIDEVKLFNRALTPSEIRTIITDDLGGNYSPPAPIDLQVRLSGAPDAILGSYVVHTVTVTNNSSETTMAEFTSALSGSGEFSDASGLEDLGCSRSDSKHARCGFLLRAGASSTITLFIPTTDMGNVTNVVTVSGPADDSDLSNNTGILTTQVRVPPVPNGTGCAPVPAGLRVWYPADGNANDVVGGRDGTLVNGATYASGIVGQGFSFDGSGSYVQVPDNPAWSFGSRPFTITLWAKTNNDGVLIASDDGSSEQNKWIFGQAGGLTFEINSPETNAVAVFPSYWNPERDRWYHLALTRDGNTYVLYVDGLELAIGHDNHVIPDASAPLTIGQAEGQFFLDGQVDEIGIYDRALSQSEIQSIFNAGTYGLCKTSSFTGIGQNIVVQTTGADLTFSQVAATGTSSVVPIDPATVGQVPGGFAVSNSVAYEISTTAVFTGPVTLAFKVPGPISLEDFNSLAVLHNVNGTLVDVTATSPARDYSTLTIYATTDSFSPFYLARKGPHIKTLFDQTKAYKSGSTIPVKLQLLSASNSNASSSNTALVARDLRLMSGNTTALVVDSGNSNPDYTFRYDATLGGTGGGYIFNLSTKGLAPGQYVLSFYVGSDRSFLYTVRFEVR